MSENIEKVIEKTLHTDPIHEAEKCTGKSYKEDEFTAALGVSMFFAHNKEKEALLEFNGDTVYNSKIDYYVSVIEKIGFQLIQTFPFEDQGRQEKQCFYYKPGCLLVFDTYHGKINGSHIYFNWSPTGGHDAYAKINENVTHSGCWCQNIDVWSGNNDAREGIKHQMMLLERYGSFVYPWIKRPFFSLCHYMDWKNIEQQCAETNKVTDAKLLLLSEEVRKMIPERQK